MLNRKEIRRIFKKPDVIEFKGRKIKVWGVGYWIIQPFLVGFWYRLYFSRLGWRGWENVPENKPVIFAISHRNAFMDALAIANRKSTQIWQLARGDAFKGKFLNRIFTFFHMLPIWREQDGENVDTIKMNQPTFEACYDILSKNGMVGIYPEGNCINEPHIRPLKKGICRIAFGAMEKYNFNIDVQIVPVGISYTGAEKFKKWQFMSVGKAIPVKKYEILYKQNPGQAIMQLKEEVERGMRETVVHIRKSEHQTDIEHIANMIARNELISSQKPYIPETKNDAEKLIVAKLEKLNHGEPDKMRQLIENFNSYQQKITDMDIRENTFDKQRQLPFVMFVMAIYFILFSPIALFGFFTNYIPYKFLNTFVESRIKQKIFRSSAKYALGIFLFPLWYLILTVICYLILGSALSAIIFLFAFPICGHIAFYFWQDVKKWLTVFRYKRMDPVERAKIEFEREKIITMVGSLPV